MSASASRPWTRHIKRATLQGGGRGKKGKPFFRGEAAYVRRLRRLEIGVLHLCGKISIDHRALDKLLESMLELKDVKEPVGSGGQDAREALPIPHPGPADGQGEGDPGADRRIRAELEAWLEREPEEAETPEEEA